MTPATHSNQRDPDWSLHSVTRVEEQVVELAPSGCLDRLTGLCLGARLDALVDAGFGEIVIDFGKLRHVDRDGIAPVLAAARHLDARGGSLVAQHPTSSMIELFDDAPVVLAS